MRLQELQALQQVINQLQVPVTQVQLVQVQEAVLRQLQKTTEVLLHPAALPAAPAYHTTRQDSLLLITRASS